MVYGMVLSVTIVNDNASDPSRPLRIQNSGLSGNLTLFWAEFGDGYPGNANFNHDNLSSFFDFKVISMYVHVYMTYVHVNTYMYMYVHSMCF